MKNDVKMYYYLRRYLSPLQSFDLVKEQYPKMYYSIQDLENMRLGKRFKVRYVQ